MYALNIDATRRILSVTYPEYAAPDAVIVAALPEGDITDYLLLNGEYVYDPLPRPEPPAPEPTVWDELDGAYTAGYESGYYEGVNSI